MSPKPQTPHDNIKYKFEFGDQYIKDMDVLEQTVSEDCRMVWKKVTMLQNDPFPQDSSKLGTIGKESINRLNIKGTNRVISYTVDEESREIKVLTIDTRVS